MKTIISLALALSLASPAFSFSKDTVKQMVKERELAFALLQEHRKLAEMMSDEECMEADDNVEDATTFLQQYAQTLAHMTVLLDLEQAKVSGSPRFEETRKILEDVKSDSTGK